MLVFDNSSQDAVNTRHNSQIAGLDEFTMSAWVRLDSLVDYQHVMNKGDDTGTQFGMQAGGPAGEGSNDVICNAKNGGSDSTQYGETSGNILSADGEFHHWCMVYNGSGSGNSEKLRFFFDGAEQSLTYYGTIPTTMDPFETSANLYLGRARWDAGIYFDGAIDDTRLYARAISDEEVLSIYATRGHDGIWDNLLLRYTLDTEAPGTIDGYPVNESTTETSFNSSSTDHDVQMPATVLSGELLFISIALAGSSPIEPSGWFTIWNETNSSCNHAVFYRLTDGTEGGTTVNVQSSSGANGAAQVRRVSGTNQFILYGVPSTGSSANPDPPSISYAYYESGLWIAFAGASDDDESFTGFPSGFTDGVSTLSGGGLNNSAEVGSAVLEYSDLTVDAGTFTLTSSEAWVAGTVQISPRGIIPDHYGPSYIFAVPVNTPTYDGDVLSKRRRFL